MMSGMGRVRPDPSTAPKPVDDPAARTLVKEAHGRMHKWPADFRGYRATLLVNEEGRVWTGTVKLVPRKETTVELPGADAALQEWVRERLWTQGMHLAFTPFEEGDGKYVLSFAPDDDPALPHPRGRKVLLTGGAARFLVPHQGLAVHADRSPLANDRAAGQYDRTIRGGAQRRLYSSHYVMTYFTLDGQSVIGMESYVNDYADVRGLWLPRRRSVSFGDGGVVKTRTIELSNHEVVT